MPEEFSQGSEVNRIFSSTCNFVAGANNIDQIPYLEGMSEYAFLGRSNVGKSSIINTLVKRRNLVRVSSNPGCTRQINFYMLGNFLVLVDLPGYGFARISKEESYKWNFLISRYLTGRKELKRVFMLIDSRHGLKDSDRQVFKLLDNSAISYQIVLTKSDKTTKQNLNIILNDIEKEVNLYTALHPEILVTSIYNESSISELQNEIIKINNQ